MIKKLKYLLITAALGLLLMPSVLKAQMEGFDAADFMLSILSDVEFYKGGMKKVTLKDYRGKVVVLAFWGTWCPPCIEEMPSLDRMKKDMEDEDLAIVAVAENQKGDVLPSKMMDDVNKFYKRYKINNLEKYVDIGGELFGMYDVKHSLPAVIFLDRDGKEIDRINGLVYWDDADMRKRVRGYLDK